MCPYENLSGYVLSIRPVQWIFFFQLGLQALVLVFLAYKGMTHSQEFFLMNSQPFGHGRRRLSDLSD